SVNELRRIGIQPDIIVARCEKMIDSEALQKIALFGTIPTEAVFCSYNVPTIYLVPQKLDEQGMGDYICRRLRIEGRKPSWRSWDAFVDSLLNPKHEVKVALVGKYTGLADSYASMNEAFRHAGAKCGVKVKIDYIEAETFEKSPGKVDCLRGYDGVFVPYGFGPRGSEGKIMAINFARTHDLPFLGVCFGFQLAVVEFARNVCGLEDANSTELNPDTPHPVIDLMPEQQNLEYKGATMRLGSHEVMIKEDTLAHKLYGSLRIFERHRHRWEVNPKYWDILEKNGLLFSGSSPDGRRMEVIELPDKFFFFATQFHGEFKSRPGRPDPEYYGFVKSCLERKMGKQEAEFS
ncbi:MAG: CTP synthase, partial [Candidatus Bathyarchaeia archaeon]